MPISLLEALGARMVHAGWQAAVLGLCVLVVSAVLGSRLPARGRFALWLVVFARLALPVVPSAPWSLFRLLPALGEGPTTSAYPAPQAAEPTERPMTLPAARPVTAPVPVVAVAPPEPGTPGEPIPEPSLSLSLSPVQGLAVLWAVGGPLLVLRRIWLGLRLARQRRSWRPVVDAAISATFAECLRELRVARRVELLWAPGPAGPATLRVSCLHASKTSAG